jgi:hypothetical protein
MRAAPFVYTTAYSFSVREFVCVRFCVLKIAAETKVAKRVPLISERRKS